MVLDEILGGVAGLHQVGRHGEDGRQAPQAATIVPVTEALQVFPFLHRLLFHSQGQAQQRRHAAQHTELRQPVMERPAHLLGVLHKNMVQHGQAEQGPQQLLGPHIPGHRGGKQEGHQGIEAQAQDGMDHGRKAQCLYSKEHTAQPYRNSGAVQAVPAIPEQNDLKAHVGQQGQHDLEPEQSPGHPGLSPGPNQAQHGGGRHEQRCQDRQDADLWHPIYRFLFHNSLS